MTAISNLLKNTNRLALDSSIFIYQVEANTKYQHLTDQIFQWLEQPGHSAVTSTITMTELLVKPYQLGYEQSVNQFYALLTTYPNLEWIAPDLDIADLAAKLRALHRLRTPDALIAATAMRAKAGLLVTNDPIFRRIPEIETLVLDDLASQP